jgi:hypothetical protein
MAGPFIVVVASVVTAWIAWKTNDGLVTEDYYKKGLTVGETITQSARATDLGVKARLALTSETVVIRVSGAEAAGFVSPKALNLTLSHPTRAGLDQTLALNRDGDAYTGRIRLPASGHWLVLLEDDAKSWRLMASVTLPALGEIVIGGATPADIRN